MDWELLFIVLLSAAVISFGNSFLTLLVLIGVLSVVKV